MGPETSSQRSPGEFVSGPTLTSDRATRGATSSCRTERDRPPRFLSASALSAVKLLTVNHAVLGATFSSIAAYCRPRDGIILATCHPVPVTIFRISPGETSR